MAVFIYGVIFDENTVSYLLVFSVVALFSVIHVVHEQAPLVHDDAQLYVDVDSPNEECYFSSGLLALPRNLVVSTLTSTSEEPGEECYFPSGIAALPPNFVVPTLTSTSEELGDATTWNYQPIRILSWNCLFASNCLDSFRGSFVLSVMPIAVSASPLMIAAVRVALLGIDLWRPTYSSLNLH